LVISPALLVAPRLARGPVQLPQTALWFAGIAVLFGLLATRDAYRRWLVTDLD
jgi:hypothetical protein